MLVLVYGSCRMFSCILVLSAHACSKQGTFWVFSMLHVRTVYTFVPCQVVSLQDSFCYIFHVGWGHSRWMSLTKSASIWEPSRTSRFCSPPSHVPDKLLEHLLMTSHIRWQNCLHAHKIIIYHVYTVCHIHMYTCRTWWAPLLLDLLLSDG